MHIIKLDATDSTNLYLKNLMTTETVEDLTVVIAKAQTKGRGQMGTIWQASAGKNLTFSVLKTFNSFFIQHQFDLNIAVSLAMISVLKTLNIPNLKIKWPNDILSGSSKICGILIENILEGQHIKASIVGIGLNVNQTDYPNLSNVSSLKLLLHKNLNLDNVLSPLLESLEHYLKMLDSGKTTDLKASYLESLYMYREKANFQRPEGESFTGRINGISETGRLQVLSDEGVLNEFDMKQIKLVY